MPCNGEETAEPACERAKGALGGDGNIQADASLVAQIVETLQGGLIAYDGEDRIVMCNAEMSRLYPKLAPVMRLGGNRADILALAYDSGQITRDDETDGGEDRKIWITQREKDRDSELSERTYQLDDGRWIHARNIRLPNGLFVGLRNDVTELKRNEAELIAARENSDRLVEDIQGVIDSMRMGVLMLDRNLNAEIINRAFYDIWSLDPDEAPVGIGFADLLSTCRSKGYYDVPDEDWNDYVQKRCGEVASGDIEPTEFERADGSANIYAVRTLNNGKRLVTYYDITEQKQREAALEEAEQKAVLADRAKSEFLANMSHEIRTPMNGVLGMSELLARTELDSKQKAFTDIIVKSGNALLTIINDILDFSKIDAGQLTLDPAPFVLSEAIEDVASLVSTRAKEKDLELIVRVEPGLPECFNGDVGRIRQVVTNLMGNAVKFTEIGHVLVDVRGEAVEDGVRLHFDITDTGIGIPADMLDNVFEKFSQVDASSTRKHEGTGLGLAITTRLVSLMGGEIGVESEEGEGSTFWFEITLPVAGNRSNRKAAPVDVSGSRILIIDDNPVNRSILLEQTASWKLDSCAAASGKEGLMVLEKATEIGLGVDCVILDYQMPEMNGEDVALAIRNNPGIGDVPIIMLTSVDQTLNSATLRQLNIEAHMIKPARSSQLMEELVKTIQKHKNISGTHSHSSQPAISGSNNDEFPEFIDTDDEDWDGPAGEQENVLQPTSPDLAAFDSNGDTATAIADADPVVEVQTGSEENLDILVAEDNEVNQMVFTQILQDTGRSFKIVENGRLAVEAWKKLCPGMILMDVSMPEMNGHEATAAIREIEKQDSLEKTPIVGVTAHALKGDKERCFEVGMDDYLSKPVSPDMLTSKLDKWLDGGKNQAESMAS